MATTADTPIKKTTKTPRKKIVTDMQECTDTCSRESCCGSGHKTRGIIIVFLLLVNLLAVSYVRYSRNDFEIMRNGGRENYEKIIELMETDSYKQYATQGVEMMIMQIQQQSSQQMNTLPIENNTGTKLDETSLILNEAEENSDI